MNRSPLAGVGGVWLCGALLVGGGAVAALPASGQGAAQEQASSTEAHDARLAYETGLLLHEQGEYEVAIELFIEAIAGDPSQDAVYRALTAAQVAGAQHRLALAIDAAGGGDLPAAARHARRAAELDGENDDAVMAARSVADASAVLSAAQLARFEQAQALTDDRQWGLAKRQLTALVAEAPLFLPGRSALQRAAYFEGRAVAMANEGVALMQQGRLTPAAEQLSGAVAIWPYHPDADAALEQAVAGRDRAADLADEAAQAMSEGQPELTLELARRSLAIDSANQRSRLLERDASRGLADRAIAAGDAEVEQDAFAAGRAHYAEALSYVPRYPEARQRMARAYSIEGSRLGEAGRPGAALLSYLAGQEHGRRLSRRSLGLAESRVLAGVDLSYALSVPEHAPALGVSSDALLGELLSQRQPAYLGRAAEGAADEAGPGYIVSVQITDTDITLRRVRSAASSFYSTGATASGYTRWEKRGGVTATVSITDRATGRVVDTWSANRWVTFSDTQQYVVGSTWQRSYWTLPSDDAIASRLARDLSAEVWPEVGERLALARARVLLAESVELAEQGDVEAALEREVAATVLAGQVNEREGARALRELSRGFVGEVGE